uniref:EF-hand domain-containing protein n=1 Tax=Aureoumbra lagunensis TaxID=44058 RepID=A0A7S3K5K3_9STRA
MKGGVDSFDEKGDNNISNEEEELLGQCLSTVKEESPRDHEMMKSDDSQMVQVQRRTTPPVIQRGMIKLGMKIGDTMDRFRPSSVGSSPGSMFSKRSKNAKSSGFTTSFLDANEESICNEENMDELLSAFDETELRKMFEEADVDRSGYLDHGELRELLKNWSKLSALNSNEVSVLMRLYDADSSGTIDYDEFLELATALSDDTSRQKLHRSIQEYMEEIDSSMHQSVDDSMHLDTGRLKVLALHGSGDNMRVTQLQVANLGLDKQKIDFVYINGPFESGPSVAQATVEGPYYTWLSSGDDSHPKKLNQIQTNILALRKVIIDAISKYGPFDGVFGFSLGGALALALMQSDVLQVLDTGTCDQKNFKRYNKDRASANNFPKNDSSPHHSFVPNNFDLEEPQIDVNTLQDGFTSNFCHKPPFKFAIVACPASLDRIRLGLGLEAKSLSNGLAQARTVHLIGTRDSLKADGDYNILQYCTLYPENSLHEKMDYSTLAGPRAVNALAKYLPIGHELPRTLRNYGALALSIIDFIEKSPYTKLPSICRWPYKKHDASLAASPQSITSNDNREVLYSGVAPIGAPRTQNIQISSIAYAKLENDHQIMEVDLRPPPECASLITALKAAPHDKIYLRGHRRSGGKHDLDQSRTNHHHRYRVEVTFGDLLNCISEGADDIRASLRLGGDNDEMLAGVSPLAPPTLAYATPPDGPASAAAAIAFFTFASLGAAAPLDAGTLESDAYDAFDQLNATTVIVWRDGIEEGIRAAAVRLGARLFEATLRTKRPLDWFFDDIYLPDEDHESSIVYRCRQAYKDAISMNIEVFKPFEEMKSQISNQNIQHVKIANGTPQNKFQQKPDHVALLLRTSGTTSKPKIVALTQSQLVTNGMALATNLELTPEDICLNAMPLFHIGGLSASILATLAAKSSVTCISGTFKAEYFAMHLGFPIDTQEDGGITQHSVSSVSTNMSGTVHSPNVSPQQSQQKKSTGRKLNSSISMSTIDNTYNDIPLPTWYSAVPTMHNAIVSYLKKYEPLSPNKKR